MSLNSPPFRGLASDKEHEHPAGKMQMFWLGHLPIKIPFALQMICLRKNAAYILSFIVSDQTFVIVKPRFAASLRC
jgi:hypothetical protein